MLKGEVNVIECLITMYLKSGWHMFGSKWIFSSWSWWNHDKRAKIRIWLTLATAKSWMYAVIKNYKIIQNKTFDQLTLGSQAPKVHWTWAAKANICCRTPQKSHCPDNIYCPPTEWCLRNGLRNIMMSSRCWLDLPIPNSDLNPTEHL